MAETKAIYVEILTPGVANDGGGWVIINGKLVRIPPRSPKLKLLTASLQLLVQTEQLADKRVMSQITALVEPIVKAQTDALIAEISVK